MIATLASDLLVAVLVGAFIGAFAGIVIALGAIQHVLDERAKAQGSQSRGES